MALAIASVEGVRRCWHDQIRHRPHRCRSSSPGPPAVPALGLAPVLERLPMSLTQSPLTLPRSPRTDGKAHADAIQRLEGAREDRNSRFSSRDSRPRTISELPTRIRTASSSTSPPRDWLHLSSDLSASPDPPYSSPRVDFEPWWGRPIAQPAGGPRDHDHSPNPP